MKYLRIKPFAEGGNTAKFVKVFTHESLRLYGIYGGDSCVVHVHVYVPQKYYFQGTHTQHKTHTHLLFALQHFHACMNIISDIIIMVYTANRVFFPLISYASDVVANGVWISPILSLWGLIVTLFVQLSVL